MTVLVKIIIDCALFYGKQKTFPFLVERFYLFSDIPHTSYSYRRSFCRYNRLPYRSCPNNYAVTHHHNQDRAEVPRPLPVLQTPFRT